MRKSHHSIKRAQQRGIKRDVIEFIEYFGAPIERRKGAVGYRVKSKDRNEIIQSAKKLIQLAERSKSKELIIRTESDLLVTNYHLK